MVLVHIIHYSCTHETVIRESLRIKVMIALWWQDLRLKWLLKTGIGNWTFPKFVDYPIIDIWTPRFKLVNCQSERCIVMPKNMATVYLKYDGLVTYYSEMVLHSTCNLNFTCMSRYSQAGSSLVKRVKASSNKHRLWVTIKSEELAILET